MSGLSLYNIAIEHRAMVNRLMEFQDDAQTIEDTIAAESFQLELKAQNVAYAVKSMEASIAAIKNAEAEMASRRKAIEKRSEALKEYAKTCMEIAGIARLECPHFALTIKKNPPAVEIFEQALIPASFMRMPEPPPPPAPTPDKKAIAEAIKAGKDVPGALLVQGTRLEIK